MRVHPGVPVPIKVLLKDLIFSQSSLQSLGAGVLYKVCELETWLHSLTNSICFLGEKPFPSHPPQSRKKDAFKAVSINKLDLNLFELYTPTSGKSLNIYIQ